MQVFTLRNLVYVILLFSALNAQAQCGTAINTFPYVEDFESSAAWTTGGPACTPLNLVINDWAWGHPQKNVINSAGSGQRCWIVGDTVGWLYAYGERSWVQSPCFDFSSVQRPYIQFKLFHESENKYDGANFQYSLNGGTTWTDVGAYGDPTDCMDTNWYNYNNITHLGSYNGPLPGHGGASQSYKSLCTGTSTNGWCGNIQTSYHDTSGVSGSTCEGGNGVGHWVTAKHCMPYLTAQSSVIFRFTFGAGTGCNNFNGFAFDSVAIGEGTPNNADFTHTCGTGNTIQFSGITSLCPDTFQWNFGDPASGSSNTITGSGSLSPSHTFSGPGTYNVTFTVKGGPCNAPGNVTKSVIIIGATTTKTDITCFGANNGTAIVTASGSSGYTYTWSTNPVQTTDTISGLGAGTYTVTVSAPGLCQVTSSVTISQPLQLSHTVIIDSASCGSSNGLISINETGGSQVYNYIWSPTGSGSSSPNLAAGQYNITITDSKGCRDSLIAVVGTNGGLQATANVVKNLSCFGNTDGSADVVVLGATGQVVYHWSNAGTSDTITNLSAGAYTVTVTDGSGCSAVKNVAIPQPTQLSHTVNSIPSSCGNNNGILTISEAGGTPNYTFTWSPSGAGDSTSNLSPGTYSVTIADQNGCRDSLTANILSIAHLFVSIDSNNISCHGKTDGRAIAVANGVAPLRYLWSNQSTSDTISNLPAGSYSVLVTDATNCTGTARVSISAPDSLYTVSTLVSDSCNAGIGKISVTVVGGSVPYRYLWSPGSSTLSQISSLTAGAYALIITDVNSCSVTENFEIGDTCIIDSLVFPSAFSPNGDGRNETFGPVYIGSVSDYQLHIYNRWGQLVFESTDPNMGWNGTYKGAPQPEGVYTYFSSFTEYKRKDKEGTLTLFR